MTFTKANARLLAAAMPVDNGLRHRSIKAQSGGVQTGLGAGSFSTHGLGTDTPATVIFLEEWRAAPSGAGKWTLTCA